MVLGTAVDSSVLSYPVLVIMKEQGADVGQGRAGIIDEREKENYRQRRSFKDVRSSFSSE